MAFRLPLAQKTNSITFKRAGVSCTEIHAPVGDKDKSDNNNNNNKHTKTKKKARECERETSRETGKKTKWRLTMAPTLYVAAGASAWL